METVRWKNRETKSFLLILLQRHLGFVIRDSRKRKESKTTETVEKKLKLSDLSIEAPIHKENLNKEDSFYMSCNYGSKVEDILSYITNNDFDPLEKVIQNPLLLEEHNKEVSSYTNGEETLLSALIFKLKDTNIQNRVCCLFLKYGLSLSTVVSKKLNAIQFFCSLKNTYSFSSNLKIICLFVFAFKDDISWNSVISTCINIQDQKKLKEFFVNSQGNFSVSTVNLESVVTNISYSSLVQSFINASVCLNKNVITDEPLKTDFLFSWIRQLIKVLSNIRETSQIGMYRENALVSILEALLIGAIQKNSYEISNKDEYLFILQQYFYFKNSDIEQRIKTLLQKHWGFLLTL